MTSPTPTDDLSDADGGQRRSARDRALQRVAAVRSRFKGSWVDTLIAQLKTLDIGEWTLVFGAELLWSMLPLLILLSSLANTRIDDDLSRHIAASTRPWPCRLFPAGRALHSHYRGPPCAAMGVDG